MTLISNVFLFYLNYSANLNASTSAYFPHSNIGHFEIFLRVKLLNDSIRSKRQKLKNILRTHYDFSEKQQHSCLYYVKYLNIAGV